MKIKHLIVATVIGTSAIGFTFHRLYRKSPVIEPKSTAAPNALHHKVASAKKISHLKHHKPSEPQLSSKKLYG